MIIGAVVFGRRWIGAADPFETYASTVARLSPWHRRPAACGWSTRWPAWPLAPPPGAAAVVSVLLGSTAFDSFANTSWWIQTVQGSDALTPAVGDGGLLVMILIVLGTFSLAAALDGPVSAVARRRRDRRYRRLMAASVVPIVVGYAVAHYATLLVVEGQRTVIGLSDPLGRGWNVFGTADLTVSSEIFNHPTAVALLQLCAIVTGTPARHRHRPRAGGHAAATRGALRGQWPMLLVMVGYTCAGLLLLFSP